MNRGLLILLVSAAPPWALSTWCRACDGESEQKVMIVTSADDAGYAHTGAAGEPQVVIARSLGDGHGMGFVTAHAVASTGDGEQKTWTRKIVLNKASGAFEDPNRGWLGVAVSEVPEALAAQLGETQGGAVISNIVKDSPADRAGLKVHDIIISVHGTAIEGDEENTVLQTANLIGAHKPGEAIDIVVIREGQEQTIRAVLGTRPSLQGVQWKFEALPHAQIEDQVKARGKVFRMEPGGGWALKDLGDLQALGELPQNFHFLPRNGNYSMKVFVDGGRKTVRSESRKDGTTLKVEQVDDGEITVTRVDASGKESVATYANVDELRSRDAEAADLYENSTGNIIVQLEGDGVEGLADLHIELDDHMEELAAKLESSFGEAQEAYQRAIEQLHEAMSRMPTPPSARGGDGRSESGALAPNMFHWPLVPPVPMVAGVQAKARQSIEVRPDGSIEVRVRKGDSELVKVYANEADLRQRDAKMFEKYQDLMQADEE